MNSNKKRTLFFMALAILLFMPIILLAYRTHASITKVHNVSQSLENKIKKLENEIIEIKKVGEPRYIVKAINHRGYNTVAPENTLSAYKLSKKMGFNIVETDISFTQDGVGVLLHDGTINRTARNADGSKIETPISIGAITYAQALQYDFGIWKSADYAGTKIPSFTQFIALCRNLGLDAYIEIKQTGTSEARVRALVEEVRKHGMNEHVTWISFHPKLLSFVEKYNNTARLGYVTRSVTEATIKTALSLKTPINEVFIDTSSYNATAVQLCKTAGLPMEVWTINNEKTMRNLNPYITGVTSDLLIYGKVLYHGSIN